MFERYSQEARRAIFSARYEASIRNSEVIETEHLLLGVLRQSPGLLDKRFSLGATRRLLESIKSESIAEQLEELFHKRDWVPGWLWRLVAKPGPTVADQDLPLSNECKRILAYTAEEAEKLRSRDINSIHLILGILRESKSAAARALGTIGISLDAARVSAADS